MPGGTPSPVFARRIEKAAALYHAGDVDRILASGGLRTAPPSEAEVARAALLKAGVPEAHILMDRHARSTYENISGAREMLPNGTKTRIVTDFYHLPRALLVAKQVGLPARGAAAPIRENSIFGTFKAIMWEIAATIWYLFRPKTYPKGHKK